MYNKFIVKQAFKTVFEDVFEGTKESASFSPGQEIEGRIDNISGKVYLVTPDGKGAVIPHRLYLEQIH